LADVSALVAPLLPDARFFGSASDSTAAMLWFLAVAGGHLEPGADVDGDALRVAVSCLPRGVPYGRHRLRAWLLFGGVGAAGVRRRP
jgi:hypothetical protein